MPLLEQSQRSSRLKEVGLIDPMTQWEECRGHITGGLCGWEISPHPSLENIPPTLGHQCILIVRVGGAPP